MIKMYCIFSKDAIKAMKGNRGKLAAQAGHAYLHAFWNAIESDNVYKRATAREYKDSDHAYKICLFADDEQTLRDLYNEHCTFTGATIVVDAAFTVFDQPTLTCVGIGPIHEADRNEKLKNLKVLI